MAEQHPRLTTAEVPCAHCGVDIWWDEDTETYEDATEAFHCAAPTAPYGAHNPL
jgi:hypothetical protein